MSNNVTELPSREAIDAEHAKLEESDQDAIDAVNATGDADLGDGAGRSIEDLADEHGEEEDGQLFVMEEGRKVTLGTLIKRSTPVEYEFKLGGKAVKGGGNMGLISFTDPDITLIVPGRAGKVEVDPTYNPDGSVKKVTIRAHVKPITAYDSRTEAGIAALRGE